MAGKFPYNHYQGRQSQTQFEVTLKILNGDDQLNFPVSYSTTVGQIKEHIASGAMEEADKVYFFTKVGPYMKKLKDHQRMERVIFVKGIKKFTPVKMEWPHPSAIIGTGYHGLKTAMTYVLDDDWNFVMFDRNNKVGGYCWITGANKTSRLQTELGSFHVWWGPEIAGKGKMSYPNCNDDKNGWHIWPYKEEILKHFDHAANRFGLKSNINFQTNVAAMEIIGDKTAESRYYQLTCENLADEKSQPYTSNCSIMWTYPGSLTTNRIIDYPGEDIFDGSIGYGMNDDCPYDKLKGARMAILGQGAFATENARTALECGATKAYIITRRKNLASPRIPCWFVHAGPLPTPGNFVLKMFEPMYKLSGFGDPWEFHAVHSNEARTNVTVLQNSRFGIGDVTFLMVIWGLLELIETKLKRLSKNTMHLENGDTLEGMTVILKALGLLGDWSIDKLHNMKEMVGPFCSGDFRRVLMIDATGMNAANFTTFSTGLPTKGFALMNKYLYDFPKEWYKAEDQGVIKSLPKHKEDPDAEKPAYVTDVKFAMTGGMIIGGMVPGLQVQNTGDPRYKYTMYHKSHGTDRVLEVAMREWDGYQAEWKKRGIEHDYVPYPYTKAMIHDWHVEWSERMNYPISVDGPTPENFPHYNRAQEGSMTSMPELDVNIEGIMNLKAEENKPN